MKLRTLRLENFGLYAGLVEFDLTPRSRNKGHAPVILIGGKNGAGKTTFLAAVRLALYGRRALGARVGQAEYETYLNDSISRNATKPIAAVELEFDYAEAGEIHRYRVRREWSANAKGTSETLLLEKDGTPITSVPREEWHQFLQELIPPGVSQLFFFDGEKIQEIAEGERDNEQLADAVRALLGIELVSRLRSDIGLYLARHQRDHDKSAAADRLVAIERQAGAIESQASTLADEVAELISARDSQARASEQIRRRFISEGGDAARNRTRVETERDEVKKAIAKSEHEIRELANKLLPFAMAPKLVGSVRKALTKSMERGIGHDVAQSMMERLDVWRSLNEPARAGRWTERHWNDVKTFLDASISTLPTASSSRAFQELGDGSVAVSRLSEIETSTRHRAVALLRELDALERRESLLNETLARASNAASGVMLDELLHAEKLVGATEATLRARQEQVKQLRGQLVMLDRDRRKLLDEQADSAMAMQRMDIAAGVAQALAEYERRLLEHKISQLRREFAHRFNHLARKANWIADLRIDLSTFAATLIDAEGNDVPKAALSAGEKQVYAISMLWALARTSGRPLPMIIDTPLARLDSEHRNNLVDRYFTSASHQVILLSTDTEIDDRLIERLRPSVSHTYHLDFDRADGCTRVTPGYFESFAPSNGGEQRALQQA